MAIVSALHVCLAGAVVLLSISGTAVNGAYAPWDASEWTEGHATYYGGQDASGTMGGSCGYGNLYSTGYGTETAALSVALFNDGYSCGGCYQLVCRESEYCLGGGGKSITVTATNLCPQGSYGGWCDNPKYHFDLSYDMFTSFARAVGGHVAVQFRKVSCSKSGGVRITITGSQWYFLTLFTNIGGSGSVNAVSVRGEGGGWTGMTHSWGALYYCNGLDLVGDSLSFDLTLTTGASKVFGGIGSGFQKTYEAGDNF